MESLQLDKKTMIHIGAEIVIFGGIVFWLNSKISNKDETIARLEKENKEMMERLKRIEMFLNQASGGNGPTTEQPAKKSKSKKSKQQELTTSGDESVVQSSEDEELEI